MELTRKQINREDFVDNAIYNLLQELNPTSRIIEWNIELIGKVRDSIIEVIVNDLEICDENTFYPYIENE